MGPISHQFPAARVTTLSEWQPAAGGMESTTTLPSLSLCSHLLRLSPPGIFGLMTHGHASLPPLVRRCEAPQSCDQYRGRRPVDHDCAGRSLGASAQKFVGKTFFNWKTENYFPIFPKPTSLTFSNMEMNREGRDPAHMSCRTTWLRPVPLPKAFPNPLLGVSMIQLSGKPPVSLRASQPAKKWLVMVNGRVNGMVNGLLHSTCLFQCPPNVLTCHPNPLDVLPCVPGGPWHGPRHRWYPPQSSALVAEVASDTSLAYRPSDKCWGRWAGVMMCGCGC